MKRQLAALQDDVFDILVVGGGIHGAFAAWDAALRGMHVALIDRGDFGGATSSNSLKIAHGGLRHLQTGDIAAVVQSLREQIALRRIAPHLVRPLPCVMRTGGALTRSPAVLQTALTAYDLIVRSQHADSQLTPEPGRLLDREEITALVQPLGVKWDSGALWFDAIIESPERLLIGVVRSAVAAGVTAASYVEALDVVTRPDSVIATSLADSEKFEIRARVLLDATNGRWHRRRVDAATTVPTPNARACNIVLRFNAPSVAVSLQHPTERRMLFAVPWRDRLMVGTSYQIANSNDAGADGSDVERLLADFNAAAPAAHAGTDDVVLVHSGLLPALPMARSREVALQRRPRLAVARGYDGRVISMAGVKWTTARAVAERGVDLCQRKLGLRLHRGGTDRRQIDGALTAAAPNGSNESSPGRLELYGTIALEIQALETAFPALGRPLSPGSTVTGAQVVHAIREEMALHLDDIVLRRTEMGTSGCPTAADLTAAADIAANELGWSPEQAATEVDHVMQRYRW